VGWGGEGSRSSARRTCEAQTSRTRCIGAQPGASPSRGQSQSGVESASAAASCVKVLHTCKGAGIRGERGCEGCKS
jgi:hypothetical protein